MRIENGSRITSYTTIWVKANFSRINWGDVYSIRTDSRIIVTKMHIYRVGENYAIQKCQQRFTNVRVFVNVLRNLVENFERIGSIHDTTNRKITILALEFVETNPKLFLRKRCT